MNCKAPCSLHLQHFSFFFCFIYVYMHIFLCYKILLSFFFIYLPFVFLIDRNLVLILILDWSSVFFLCFFLDNVFLILNILYHASHVNYITPSF